MSLRIVRRPVAAAGPYELDTAPLRRYGGRRVHGFAASGAFGASKSTVLRALCLQLGIPNSDFLVDNSVHHTTGGIMTGGGSRDVSPTDSLCAHDVEGENLGDARDDAMMKAVTALLQSAAHIHVIKDAMANTDVDRLEAMAAAYEVNRLSLAAGAAAAKPALVVWLRTLRPEPAGGWAAYVAGMLAGRAVLDKFSSLHVEKVTDDGVRAQQCLRHDRFVPTEFPEFHAAIQSVAAKVQQALDASVAAGRALTGDEMAGLLEAAWPALLAGRAVPVPSLRDMLVLGRALSFCIEADQSLRCLDSDGASPQLLSKQISAAAQKWASISVAAAGAGAGAATALSSAGVQATPDEEVARFIQRWRDYAEMRGNAALADARLTKWKAFDDALSLWVQLSFSPSCAGSTAAPLQQTLAAVIDAAVRAAAARGAPLSEAQRLELVHELAAWESAMQWAAAFAAQVARCSDAELVAALVAEFRQMVDGGRPFLSDTGAAMKEAARALCDLMRDTIGPGRGMMSEHVERVCATFTEAVANYVPAQHTKFPDPPSPHGYRGSRWSRYVRVILSAAVAIAVSCVMPVALASMGMASSLLTATVTGATAGAASTAVSGGNGRDIAKGALRGGVLAAGSSLIGDAFSAPSGAASAPAASTGGGAVSSSSTAAATAASASSSSAAAAAAASSTLAAMTPNVSTVALKCVAEGVLGGSVNIVFGGSGSGAGQRFVQGFFAGAAAEVCASLHLEHGWQTAAASGASSAAAAALFGGSVEEAFLQGVLVATMNHAAHAIKDKIVAASASNDAMEIVAVVEGGDATIVLDRESNTMFMMSENNTVFQVLAGAGEGVVDFVVDTVTGLLHVIRHPIDTASAAVTSIYNYKETAAAIRDSFAERFERVSDPSVPLGDRVRLATQTACDVVSTVVGAGAAAKVALKAPKAVMKLPASAAQLSDSAFLQRVVNAADRAVAATPGMTPQVLGTLKHSYAERLTLRYQASTGRKLNLLVEQRFLDGVAMPERVGAGTRLDFFCNATGTVYDAKFGAAGVTAKQVRNWETHVPDMKGFVELRPTH